MSPSPIEVGPGENFLTFWLKIVHFSVYSTELKSVKYTIPYIYLHLSLLGGGYARPPGGTSRSINWGVDITGGFDPSTVLTLRLWRKIL